MSYCVPEWNVDTASDLDVVIPSTDLFPLSKGKWELSNRIKSNYSDMAAMPDHDFEELCWENGQLLLVTQGQKQRHWQPVNSSSQFSTVSDNEDSGLSSRSQVLVKDDILEAVVHDIGGVAKFSEGSNYIQKDEMPSWLHNDEPLGKELQTNISRSSSQMQKGFNDAVEPGQNTQNLKIIDGHTVHGGLLGSAGCDSLSKSENAAMAIEIGSSRVSRVSNLQSLAGAQALHINSNPKQCDVSPSRKANGALLSCSTRGSSALSRIGLSKGIPGPASIMVPTQMAPPKTELGSTSVHGSSQSAESGLLNFLHFSRPAAIVKANLQTIGMDSWPTGAERLIQLDRIAAEACTSAVSSIESTSTGKSTLCGQMDGTTHSGASGDPQNVILTSSLLPMQTLLTTNEASLAACVDEAVEPSNAQNSLARSNGVLGIAKGTVVDSPEPTATFSGDSAGNSAGKCRKVDGSPGKRKNRDLEDLEWQCEDPEDESADVRKPPPARLPSTKRSRAAESHNLSERRRRDRINEKMRALQELIPNSNKTDKASLLEEAIEYLKMLQTQIQVMSFRSAMSVSPVLMPPTMQHLQMSQVSSLPHIGTGIGAGAGTGMCMGLGMMDMGTGTHAGHALPFPSFPGKVVTGSVVPTIPVPAIPAIPAPTLPTSAMFVSTMPVSACPGTPMSTLQHAIFPTPMAIAGGHNFQASNVRDYKASLTCQKLQAMNANMYNSLMIPHHPNQAQRNCSTASAPLL